MKLLIDTNILLDVLQKRIPHYQDSSIIWKMCETGQVSGHISALTFANIVYVLKKELTPDNIERTFSQLSLIFTFESLSVTDLENAAALKWNDFEDALQAQTAARINADCIITRNIKDFLKSKIPVYTPTEFIARMLPAGE